MFFLKNAFRYSDFIPDKKNILDFVRNKIKKQNYIVIVLNEKFLPTGNNIEFDFYHNWFCFGFDDKKKIVYMAGYIYKNGFNEYKVITVGFYDFIRAVPFSNENTNYEKNIMNNHYFKFNDYYFDKKNNCTIDKIKKILFKHINKLKPITNNINIYTLYIIHSYILYFTKCRPLKRELFDIRDIKTIQEHVMILKYIIIEYSNLLYLKQEIEELNKITQKLLYKVMKLKLKKNLTTNKKDFFEICRMLNTIRKKEYKIIAKFLKG